MENETPKNVDTTTPKTTETITQGVLFEDSTRRENTPELQKSLDEMKRAYGVK